MFYYPLADDAVLRILEEHHAEALFQLTLANRLHLLPWLPWVDQVIGIEDTLGFIRQGLTQFAAGEGFQAGIWRGPRLVGVIGFHGMSRVNRSIAIGYWLAAAHQGRGLMTRACEALLRYAFEDLGLHRVEIRCAPANHRSRAIPIRLGFQEEGLIRAAQRGREGYDDLVVYGLLAPEWRARQSSAGETDPRTGNPRGITPRESSPRGGSR